MKTIHVVEETLPMAWEKAVLRCWEDGAIFATQYDKPGDPPSRDVSVMIHVLKPFSEPRIHRAFPGGLNDLEKYRAEVLHGVHDYFMDDTTNPNRWEYTYHERLFRYKVAVAKNQPAGYEWVDFENLTIDQIARCIEMLKQCGHTRRAQAVTWQAWNDLGIGDPACLQRMWFRIEEQDCHACNGTGSVCERIFTPPQPDADGGIVVDLCPACGGKGKRPSLNMSVDMRSNDAFKAAFMNMYAFTELQRWMAEQIGVQPGEYIHKADSFHIYGSYFGEFEGFLKLVRERPADERVWASTDMADFFVQGCDELLAEPNMPEVCKEQVRRRREQLMIPA